MSEEKNTKRTGAEPKALRTYNILAPDQIEPLGSLAALRPAGHLWNTAKSAVRALDAVDVIANSPEPLRARQIATALQLSPSSADQLLKTLVDAGYLIFDPLSKRYFLSPRLALLGGRLAGLYFAPGGLEHMLDAIVDRLQLPITLVASQGTSMQGLRQLVPQVRDRERTVLEERMQDRSMVGLQIPLFGSSSGAAWLASQPNAIVEWAYARCRRELGAAGRPFTQVLEAIVRVREHGYATGGLLAEDHEQNCGLSMALPRARNGIVLVVSALAPLRIIVAQGASIYQAMADVTARFTEAE